jgi:CheY-like chemotaxis protein
MSAAQRTFSPRPAASPRRLMVVDDDRDVVELVTLWFQSRGWEVVAAHTGPDAVARGVAFQPDVVVLDLMLPGYSGLEVLRRLRVSDQTLPIVLSTASDSDEQQAVADGADAYLVKPWSLATLEKTVESLAASRI